MWFYLGSIFLCNFKYKNTKYLYLIRLYDNNILVVIGLFRAFVFTFVRVHVRVSVSVSSL